MDSDPVYKPSPELDVIPPTVVGGYFRSFARKDLNNPPTAVGGIERPGVRLRVESI